MTTAPRHRTHRAASLVGTLTLTVLLAACGSSASTPASSGPGASSAGRGPRTPPGVSGQIAAVTGTTLQVQNTSAQTAVTYTASTPITDEVAATTADIATGLCATARPAPGDTTSTATRLTAAAIALSAPVNGVCSHGVARGGGGRRQAGSAPASGTGSRPAGVGFGASGLVTAVSGNTVTIASEGRQGAPASSTATTSAAAPPTTSVTVTTSPSTTVTKSQPGTAAELTVGACVTALGTADTTGAVTATALTLRPQVNGTCAGGARGGRRQHTTTGA